jgi:hypothetical protein
MNKLLHTPVTVLKDAANDADGALSVEIVRKVFQLDEASDTPPPPPAGQKADPSRPGDA